MGFDLLTGVFMLTPLAWIDKRPGVTIAGILRNWGLVFTGNFFGAAGLAPFHDLDDQVPQEVKDKLVEIDAGLKDGSVETGYNPGG